MTCEASWGPQFLQKVLYAASAALDVLRRGGLDDEFGNVGARGEQGQGDDDRAEVFRLDHLGFSFGGDRRGAMFEDWRIDFAGVDRRDPHAVGRDFVADAGA